MMKSLTDRFQARRARRRIVAGNRARDGGDLKAAASHYAAALVLAPHRPAIHVQHGHMLKETGHREEAEAAYRRAIAIDGDSPDSWVQLGHVLKMAGRVPDAIECYTQAIALDPSFSAAAVELDALGAYDRIPLLTPVQSEKLAANLATLSAQVSALQKAVRPYTSAARSYRAFRKLNPTTPPPESELGETISILVCVDARDRTAAALAVTLASLRDQSLTTWRAHCRVDPMLIEHPVASIGYTDSRVVLAVDDTAAKGGVEKLCVSLAAGTILDPFALAWFLFVQKQMGCVGIYADHDRAQENWRGPRIGQQPTLQPRFDPDWFGDGLSPPAVICWDPARFDDVEGDLGVALCRMADRGGAIVHIPRILSTILDLTTPVRDAPADPMVASKRPPLPAARPAVAMAGSRIAVIIPTRDQAAMLMACVDSLMQKASNRQRIEVIIVDNRSREHETVSVLVDLQSRFGAKVIVFDEPFNWSRANNMAVGSTDADQILFLNNDTEMLTSGWNSHIDRELARAEIGGLGARLLYPDRTVQHAGVIFGMGNGGPEHEGVGSGEADGGQDGRWLRRRSVAAVTGACLAMRRSVWDEVEGFDEALAVGFNDIDMALRIRSCGYRLLYVPELQLIHYESKTRGVNVTQSQVAWDRDELRTLYLKWGDKLFEDPTLNLQWSRIDAPFQSFQEPSMEAILSDIASQA